MSDVFISYSRLDIEFVARLRDAFAVKATDVWIDWESIPESRAWWEEIKKGITRCNNFAVVLSPQSMASPICHLEIEYALKLKKRIIPIYHADFDCEESLVGITKRLADPNQIVTRDIWEKRQSHAIYDQNIAGVMSFNYFFFKSDDDFDERFQALLDVIQTDYNKEKHTTFYIRAQEWDRRSRDSGFLLIDSELADAEAWLAEAESKRPPPTELQREYICTSREEENRRARILRIFRRTVIGAGILVVVLLVAAVVAAFQAADATAEVEESQATLASINTAVAAGEARIEALRLAGSSNEVLQQGNGDPAAAALLAIRSLNTVYTSSGDLALSEALGQLYLTRNIWTAQTGIHDLAFSPDGQLLATAGYAGSVKLWNYRNGELVTELEYPTISSHVGEIRVEVTALAITPDSEQILTASMDGLILWSLETGTIIWSNRFNSPREISAVEVSNDGRFAVSGGRGPGDTGSSGVIEIWNLRSGDLVQTIHGHEDIVTDIALSPDSSTIMSSSRDNTVAIWDFETGELIKVFDQHTMPVNSVAFSPDGTIILSAGIDGVRLWSVDTNDELQEFTDIGGITDATFSPDGRFILATDGWNARAFLLRVSNGEILRTFTAQTSYLQAGAYSTDGLMIATAGDSGTVQIWSADENAFDHIFTDRSGVSALSIHPNGSRIAAGNTGGEITIFDLNSDAQVLSLEGHTDAIIDLIFSSDGMFLLSGSTDHTARLWNVESGESVYTLQAHTQPISSVDFSSNSQLALTSGYDHSIRIWDVTTGDLLEVFQQSDPVSATFSPNDNSILYGSFRSATLIDAASGDYQQSYYAGQFMIYVDAIAFSPDGSQVLTASLDEPVVRIWDTLTGEQLQELHGHIRGVGQVTYSRDGAVILTRGVDQTIRLWDVGSYNLLRAIRFEGSKITSVAISESNNVIIVANEDGEIFSVPIDYQDFVTSACTHVFRDFTSDERRIYGINSSESTCP